MREYEGVVRVADHPELQSAWSRRARSGLVIRALPGVVMDVKQAQDPFAWVRAAHAWNPNAVIAGRAAARLTYDSETIVDEVAVYTATKISDRGRLRFVRHPLHPKLTMWRGAFRVTIPEASGLTAALAGDFEPATTALRKSLATPSSLADAARLLDLRPARRLHGVIRDLSGNPWSVAEVQAHRILRDGGVSGWVGNHEVVAGGRTYFLDIAFPEARIFFEVNSFLHHSRREAMSRDAAKANALVADGWRMYTLTTDQIAYHPEATLDFIRSVLRRRELRRGCSGTLRGFTRK
jgi:very-short-patch-repair endonuclease